MKTSIALFSAIIFSIISQFAEAALNFSIDTELKEIVMSKPGSKDEPIRLAMADGIAYWHDDTDYVDGFFTFDAMEKAMKKEGLHLLKSKIASSGNPGSLEKGLYFVFWEKSDKKGAAVPILFNFLGAGVPGNDGRHWNSGQFWIPAEKNEWLVDGKEVYW